MTILQTLVDAIKTLFHDCPAEHRLTRDEVMAKLADLAQRRGENMDLTSIVDVQKLLDKPSEFSDRKTLWAEAEQPGTYIGSAEQNVKLLDIVIDWVVDREVPIPKE